MYYTQDGITAVTIAVEHCLHWPLNRMQGLSYHHTTQTLAPNSIKKAEILKGKSRDFQKSRGVAS